VIQPVTSHKKPASGGFFFAGFNAKQQGHETDTMTKGPEGPFVMNAENP
jgi:hypothetical protein